MNRFDDQARMFRRRAAETFDTASSFYGVFDFFSRGIMGKATAELSRIVPMGPGTSVLEVFCATGLFSRILARTGAHVLAVDISSQMIRRAKRAAGVLPIDYLVTDAGNLPFHDGSFDLVVAARGLHAMPPSVRDRAVLEIHRVCGSWALFMEPKRPRGILQRAVMGILERLEGGYEDWREFIATDFSRYLTARGFSPRVLFPDSNEHVILCRKGL